MQYRTFILIISLFWLTGCAAPVGSNPLEPQSAMALQPTITASPTGTATATPSPTEIDWGALPITSTALQQGRESNDLEGTRIAQVYEKQTVEVGWSNLTSTAAAATNTQSAVNIQSTEVRVVATKNAAGTMTPEAAKHAAEVEQIQTQTRMITIRESAIVVVVVVVGFWALAAIFRGAGRNNNRPAVTEKPAEQPKAQLVTVKLDTRDEYGWGAVNWSTCPVDLQTLKDVAALIVGGANYVQIHLTGAGKPLVKDGNFNTLGDWLVSSKVMIKTSDNRYIIRQHGFFEQVMEK